MMIGVQAILWLAVALFLFAIVARLSYRAGKDRAVREMAMLQDWADFRESRRKQFAETIEEDSPGNAVVHLRGAAITTDEYKMGTKDALYGRVPEFDGLYVFVVPKPQNGS